MRFIMKKKFRRMMAFLLAAAMLCSMAACNKGNGDKDPDKTTSNKEFVWVPEFVKLDVDGSLYDAVISGDYLYYENYQWDEETMKSKITIDSCSMTDGSAGPSIEIPGLGYDEEAGSSRNLSSFMFDGEGNLVTLEYIYRWNEKTNESSQEYYICRYDASGERTFENDFSEVMTRDGSNSWIQYACMDGENRIYMACDTVVHLFDAEGVFCGTIDLGTNGWIDSMGAGKDGKMYVAYRDYNNNSTVLREMDFAGRSLGATYENFVDGYSRGGLAVGTDADFMVYDGNGLYAYDMKTQTSERILEWLDCDIYGDNIQGIKAMEDGRIMVTLYDWEADGPEIATLALKPAAEVKEKTEIVLGTLYSNGEIRRAAVNFNKSSDEYHVSMRSYFDYNDVTYSGETSNYQEVLSNAATRLNNDIISDNCPDILVLEGVNVSRFAQKGVFEDLNSYLDGGSVIKRGDYFENVLDAFTYNGTLVSIPKSFSLDTLAGRTADLGEERGWTLSEMLSYAEEHPDAELLAYGTKSSTLQSMFQYNQGNFVDWETGKCSFEDESFVKLLELANHFAPEYEYDEDAPSYPSRLAAGEILLSRENIYDFNEMQVPEAMYGEAVTFIGFPNESGDSGTYLSAGSGLAITSKSAHKEGAWKFMESWLGMESERYSWGFSTKKAKFEEAKAEAMKVNYILDENGQPMLDENGDPMTYGMGGFGYDDWFYEYHSMTAEEAELLEELIAGARPVTDFDMQITNIVLEEAEAFFKGQRSAKDVAGIIQSRVGVYVDENR